MPRDESTRFVSPYHEPCYGAAEIALQNVSSPVSHNCSRGAATYKAYVHGDAHRPLRRPANVVRIPGYILGDDWVRAYRNQKAGHVLDHEAVNGSQQQEANDAAARMVSDAMLPRDESSYTRTRLCRTL